MTTMTKLDLPWMDARKNCNVRNIFVQLRERVKADSKDRNAAFASRFPPESHSKGPIDYSEESDSFRICRDQAHVKFVCSEQIEITGAGVGSPKIISVSVLLDNNGECMTIDQDGNRIPLWRIVYLALDALFFYPSDS